MASKTSLSDLVLRPQKVVEALKTADKRFTVGTFLFMVVVTAIFGMVYAGVFSEDKLYILKDAAFFPLALTVTLFCTYPVMVLLTRAVSSDTFLAGKNPLKRAFSVLSVSLMYAPLALLITTPLYLLASLNEYYFGYMLLSIVVMVAVLAVAVIFGRLLVLVYKMPAWKAAILVILVGAYMLLLFINVASLLTPFSAHAYHYYSYSSPVFEAAAQASVVG